MPDFFNDNIAAPNSVALLNCLKVHLQNFNYKQLSAVRSTVADKLASVNLNWLHVCLTHDQFSPFSLSFQFTQRAAPKLNLTYPIHGDIRKMWIWVVTSTKDVQATPPAPLI